MFRLRKVKSNIFSSCFVCFYFSTWQCHKHENRLYFGEKNIPGMLAVLEPLHAILERGPQTLKETSFFQVN